jgi:peptidoglycan/LPS O-acetylase OafA/YrhL
MFVGERWRSRSAHNIGLRGIYAVPSRIGPVANTSRLGPATSKGNTMTPHLIISDIYRPWYVIPVIAMLLWLFSTRHFAFLDEPSAQNERRSTTVDGLRGFLALGVFFAHSSGYALYVTTGYWGAGPSAFFDLLGSTGVALFFTITSYLFWGKAIAGASSIHSAREYCRYLFCLYTARFFRIAPLYYFVIAFMLAIVLSVTGPRLNVSPSRCFTEICNWLLLGLGANVWVNGYGGPPVMTGMVWTLGWEWYFYFSLAATSLIAFSRTGRLVFPLVTFAISALFILNGHEASFSYIILFSTGMTFAALPDSTLRVALSERAKSLAALTLIGAVYSGVAASHTLIQTLLIAALFYLVISGCDLFGLLRSRAAQRLGAISYSIYLTHGICLHLLFSNAQIEQFALGSVAHYWIVVALAALLVTVFSSLTFICIERQGIALGRSLLRRSGLARTKRAPSSTAAAA